MQSSKDTFYVALRDRLAVINPQRTVVLNGATRPAVVAVEDEAAADAVRLPECFYLEWGATRVADASVARPLLATAAMVTYSTAGSDGTAGCDRAHILSALDLELLQMCAPPHAGKSDYTQATPAPLGSRVFWNAPEFAAAELDGSQLTRAAKLEIFFYPEVDFR